MPSGENTANLPSHNGGPLPPTYTAQQPQILITPLPDSVSFFWGQSVQGEVFVKGLGQGGQGVEKLTARLHLTDELPLFPSIELHQFPETILYPPPPTEATVSQSTFTTIPFSAPYRFTIPLPSSIDRSTSTDSRHPSLTDFLPGALDLTAYDKGAIRWTLIVSLTLSSGQTTEESISIENTPQELCPMEDDGPVEIEETLERSGVRVRLLLDTDHPRLGDLLRCGVEVQPKPREKTGVAGLSSQPNPSETLRPLRRVRVELYRLVRIPPPSDSSSNSSTTDHLTLLHSSGKSLRYPGTSRIHPPLRLLFTLPTLQSSAADMTWGEISCSTPYHQITFFIRVIIGFGAPSDSGSSDSFQWTLERGLTIRPKIWKEPREVIIERGHIPSSTIGECSDDLDPEEAREAYRLKGRDVVGQMGTIRVGEEDVPGFEEVMAGPSNGNLNGLPTFLESEEQMRKGEGNVPLEAIPSETLLPMEFEEDGIDRALRAGRPDNLMGELATWIEYDGYETFSVQPPLASASFGVDGPMDPPEEGVDTASVVGGIAARLGLRDGASGGVEGMMNHLGLGEGTRVVDMQDDLPPGIDEPSLPALPGPHPHSFDSPPSFAASEAAQAVGMVAVATPNPARVGQRRTSHATQVDVIHGEVRGEPPGYFGGERPEGGLPPTWHGAQTYSTTGQNIYSDLEYGEQPDDENEIQEEEEEVAEEQLLTEWLDYRLNDRRVHKDNFVGPTENQMSKMLYSKINTDDGKSGFVDTAEEL
ncbi:hypothetical protein M231_03480 [Tremella mesenterica]|uniref:Uncharacterized protein n=1 Tax=Tremella mesenterica TaxID=5217 RepID=A0A4Q1BNC4_TREME|nr:hypothetical protein M231_03480 [Tremella mesenterica]